MDIFHTAFQAYRATINTEVLTDEQLASRAGVEVLGGKKDAQE